MTGGHMADGDEPGWREREVALTSKELATLIRRVNARIPEHVTPSTRIVIHPSEWLTLVEVATGNETCDALDAERYRFLRQPGNAIVYARGPNVWGEGHSGHVKWDTPEALDAAVDAARGSQKALEQQPLTTVCQWEPIEEGSRCYNTCRPGEEFNLDDGCEPYPFCHWCGRPIVIP